jgi:flagellar hook-length control protein FliK
VVSATSVTATSVTANSPATISNPSATAAEGIPPAIVIPGQPISTPAASQPATSAAVAAATDPAAASTVTSAVTVSAVSVMDPATDTSREKDTATNATATDATSAATTAAAVTATAQPAPIVTPAVATVIAPNAPLALPTHQQIAGALNELKAGVDGTHRLVLALHPIDLGPVNIVARMDHGAITVQLASDNDAARAALRDSLPQLRHELEQAGFTGVGVSMDSGESTNGGRNTGEREAFSARGPHPVTSRIEPPRTVSRSNRTDGVDRFL